MTRLIKHVVAALIAVMVNLLVYQWFEPGPIEKYSRKAHPTDVYGGSILTIESTVHRTKTCSSTVYRRFIDSSGRTVDFEPFDAPTIPPGIENFVTEITIPRGMVDGRLIYQVRVNFQCNRLQRFLGGSWFILPDIHLQYSRT